MEWREEPFSSPRGFDYCPSMLPPSQAYSIMGVVNGPDRAGADNHQDVRPLMLSGCIDILRAAVLIGSALSNFRQFRESLFVMDSQIR